MRTLTIMLGMLAMSGFATKADEQAQLAALKAKIAGVWKHEHRQIGVQADTFKNYGAGGSFSATSTIRMLGTNSTVDYEGKWEILPGPVLRLEVTKTNNRLYVPKGAVYLMKDLEIENGVISYLHDGKPGREVRQKTTDE